MIAFVAGSDPDTTAERRFERLLDRPPSAKLVHRMLDEDAPLTQREIRRRALLPPPTRNVLTKLEDDGLVEERMYVPDARKRLYAPLSVSGPDEVDAVV